MLLFTAEGPRSFDDRDVIAVYRGGGDGRFTHCTLILHYGSEVSGAISNDALAALDVAGRLPHRSGHAGVNAPCAELC